MESFKDKLCKEYALTVEQADLLISEMNQMDFKKGDYVVREGERNTNFYIQIGRAHV